MFHSVCLDQCALHIHPTLETYLKFLVIKSFCYYQIIWVGFSCLSYPFNVFAVLITWCFTIFCKVETEDEATESAGEGSEKVSQKNHNNVSFIFFKNNCGCSFCYSNTQSASTIIGSVVCSQSDKTLSLNFSIWCEVLWAKL